MHLDFDDFDFRVLHFRHELLGLFRSVVHFHFHFDLGQNSSSSEIEILGGDGTENKKRRSIQRILLTFSDDNDDAEENEKIENENEKEDFQPASPLQLWNLKKGNTEYHLIPPTLYNNNKNNNNGIFLTKSGRRPLSKSLSIINIENQISSVLKLRQNKNYNKNENNQKNNKNEIEVVWSFAFFAKKNSEEEGKKHRLNDAYCRKAFINTMLEETSWQGIEGEPKMITTTTDISYQSHQKKEQQGGDNHHQHHHQDDDSNNNNNGEDDDMMTTITNHPDKNTHWWSWYVSVTGLRISVELPAESQSQKKVVVKVTLPPILSVACGAPEEVATSVSAEIEIENHQQQQLVENNDIPSADL